MKTNVGSIVKLLTSTWLVVFFIILFHAESQAQTEPFIPKYQSIKRSERCFTITREQNNQFGAVWFRDRGDFSQDTTLYFVMYFGSKNSDGADGFAFVMHNDPRDINVYNDKDVRIRIGTTGSNYTDFDLEGATGDDGGGLGYAMHSSRVNHNIIEGPPHQNGNHANNHRIWPSVAIEFDTYDNNDVPDGRADGDNDPPVSPYKGQDHTSVVYDGDLYNQQQNIWGYDVNGNYIQNRLQPLLPIEHWGWDKDAEDNGCYAFRINWIVNGDGTQTLELWADNYDPNIVDAEAYNYYLVMRHTDDMLNGVFAGHSSLRFGFTGSTGGLNNEQTICLLGGNTRPDANDDFGLTQINTPVLIDVESNDFDQDGDNLFVPIIVNPPANGSATVRNSADINPGDTLNINYIEYTPNANFTGRDTLRYRTCDVDSDKCYALCDEAFVYITVGCDDVFISAAQTAPYTLCDNSLTADGAAEIDSAWGSFRTNIWVETFNYNNGTTSGTPDIAGTPPVGWSFTTNGACINDGNTRRAVSANRFRVRNTGCEVEWETGVIDIAGIINVNVSIFLSSSGNTLGGSDYLRAYYILDGGPEVPLTNGMQTGNFGSATASAVDLNGSTLQIKVYALNNNNFETYYWDDVYVNGVTPGGAAPPMTYHWYAGSVDPGNYHGSGTTIGELRDSTQTTYYVYGLDSLTGCHSDTVAVNIAHEPDSFVVETAKLANVTNCETDNGALEAFVIEDSDSVTTGFVFDWYLRESPGSIFRTGHEITGLGAREYVLQVTRDATGCVMSTADTVFSEVENPILNANVVSHLTSCSTPDGSATAVATTPGGTTLTESDVTFYWFRGTTAPENQVNNAMDSLFATVTELDADTFTVIARHNVSRCFSNSVTVIIEDQTETPIPVVTSATDQTSCDTNNPNGAFTAAVDEGGSMVTSGYTFTWYRGLNTTTLARTGYTSGPDVDQLPANDYRLVVVNNTSDCEAQLDTAIIENLVYPEIDTVTHTDVTMCGGSPNGSITVTPVGNIADYEYRLYTGIGVVPGNLDSQTASNVFNSLDVDDYTVTVIDPNTQCESDDETVAIEDATVDPFAWIEMDPQISCDPDPANHLGRLYVVEDSLVHDISDYTFEWFVTNTSGASVSTTSGVNGEIAHSLTDGPYALRITNNLDNCENIYYHTVLEDITYPVLDSAWSDPSTHCGTFANGVLYATANAGGSHSDIFTFTWRNDVPAVISNDSIVNNVAPGDYEVRVMLDSTACLSNWTPAVVRGDTITPNAILDPTNNSSCDVNNPNGEIEVADVTNEAPYDPANYAFLWYIGTNSSGTQLTIPDYAFNPDSSQVMGLSEENYTLFIRNKTTNCTNEVTTQIVDINIKPVLDYPTIVDATRCADPYESSVVATISGIPLPTPGYRIRLINLDTSDEYESEDGRFEDFADDDGIELPPGNYRLIALNDFDCESDEIDFEIEDDSVDPVFSLDAYDNTSCDMTQPNGIVVASRSDDSYDIDNIEWFVTSVAGSFVTSIPTATLVEQDTVATGLPANTYAVRVTAENSCSSVELISLNDVPANSPLVSLVSKEDLTSCTNPDGEITLAVTPLESLPPHFDVNRTYTFTIENSAIPSSFSSTTDGTNPIDSIETFLSLQEGTWVATVVDNYTLCESDPIDVELEQAPEIRFNVDVHPIVSCELGNGIIELVAESPGFNESPSGDGFNFQWFDGATLSAPVLTTVNDIDLWTSEAIDLESKFYTVLVTDILSGCAKDTSIFLPSFSVPILQDVVPQDATQCAPYNGSVQVDVDPGSFPTGLGYSDYIFKIYSGISFDGSDTPVEEMPNPGGGPVDFPDNLEPGTYIVVAQEDFLLSGGCYTDPLVFEIELDFELELTPILVTSDSSCTGGTPTGILNASFDATPYTVNQVDYAWYAGTSTTGIAVEDPADGDPALTTIGLPSGNYSVELVVTAGDGFGCTYTESIGLPKTAPTQIINVTIDPNRNCSPFNGAIAIDDISIGGVVHSSNNFENFVIHDEDGNEVSSAPHTAVNWGDLAPQSYYISARKITTQCLTQVRRADVLDNSQKPTLDLTLNSPDYSCTTTTGTGMITATASDVPPGVNYTWTWTDALANTVSAPPGYDNPTESRRESLIDGVYTIEVLDNDGDGINEGCSTTRNFTVTEGNAPVVTPDVVFTNQTICIDPNGSILVQEIVENREGIFFANETSAGGYSVYEAALYDRDLAPINTGTNTWAAFHDTNGYFGNTDSDVMVIPVGTYYVKAKNTDTDCPHGPPTQVMIRDVSQRPTIHVTLEEPDYSCTPSANPTGVLFARALGGSDADIDQTHFNFEWVDVANSTVVTPPDLLEPGRISELREGDYTITVTDDRDLDLNCVSSRTFSVPHNIQEIIIVQAAGTDQTWCNPNGTYQVNGLEVNGTLIDPVSDPTEFAKYSIDFFQGDLNTPFTPPGGGTGMSGSPFEEVVADTYFAVAINNETECESQPRQVIIRDRTTYPFIETEVISPNYSLNYANPASLTGILEAEAFEADRSTKAPGGYTYNWYRNMDENTDSLIITTDHLVAGTSVQTEDFLRDAMYYVNVESNLTGCESTRAIDLPFVYLKPKFHPEVLAQHLCFPPDGSIEIPEIYKVADSTETFSKYQFFWHFGNFDVDNPDTTHLGGNNTTILMEDLAANSYYIQALDTFWMVISDPVQVNVLDSTVIPVINLDPLASRPQTSCNPATPNGVLAIDVGPNDTYNYEWFAGNGTSGTNLLVNDDNIINRAAGNYTVRVRRNITNCENTRVLNIMDDINRPVLSVSTSPVTNCVPENANGVANANISNTPNSSYDFFWYHGESATGTPNFSDVGGPFSAKISSSYRDLLPGTYTVVARDTFDCASDPYMVQVRENYRYPVIEWDELSPLTHCAPDKANAVFSATADGKVAGYTFEWYLRNGPRVNTGPIANNLGANTYRLTVTNNITGCESFENVRPTEAFMNVPAPIVDFLADRSSCIGPDGEARSTAMGPLPNYYFTYLDPETLDSLTNPMIASHIYELDISDYLVFTTDRVSGCVSDSVPFTIRDIRYVPDYDVITEPSNCVEPTGSAEVVIGDLSKEFHVRWYDDFGSLGTGREIYYRPAGAYYVAVEGTEGCIDSAAVDIGTDVIIFNGVSANGDGLNDVFHIECIDLFPNNNVKIFNRAGELVYEMSYYDTYDPNRNFNGKPNKGIIHGERLAVGTYFYVVDLGTGRKPKVGYLELTR